MKMKITLLSIVLMASFVPIGSHYTFAAKEIESKAIEDNRSPLGCYNTGYQFDLKTLHLIPGHLGEPQAMYFLFNSLNQKINLYQMRDSESSYSLFLNHSINAQQWAVLSTSEKRVKFICAIPDEKTLYGKIVDCSESIRVCEFTNVRYGLNNRGNYWIVNSNSRNAALRDVVHYGIIPAL